MNRTRILIVDGNLEMQAYLADLISKESDMVLVGLVGDGVEAMHILSHEVVDVVLLDLFMPKMDGFTLLETMNGGSVHPLPQTIIITAHGRDDFIQRAIGMGVRYYLIKPFDPTVLLNRIRELAQQSPYMAPLYPAPNARARSIDDRLTTFLLAMGIPAHIKGYAFLREAIKMVIERPDVIDRITKELYPGIAKKFDTSPAKVERSIRHAIEVMWTRGRIDVLNRAYGYRVVSKENKPTNGEFIAMVATKMAMNETA